MVNYCTQRIKKAFLGNGAKNRITELDFFRGIALLLMVYFHMIRSMSEIFGYHIVYDSWINFYIGKISAILFILISGIVFSFGRFHFRRFVVLAGISIIISTATYFYNSDYVIIFGIIHFFALSSLVAVLFKNINKYMLMMIWVWIIAAWSWISTIPIHSDYLFFVWLVSKWFQSADFYPLIPWFGIYLLGMWLSKILYAKKKNLFWNLFSFNPINFVGRNTLVIYLIHQPIIIFVLYLINLFG